MNKIDRFSGEYAFLSNFYPSAIEVGGKMYLTAEHLYQSLKTSNPVQREQIRKAKTPGSAKRLGKQCDLLPNWKGFRLQMMEETVLLKFLQNLDLREKLLATSDAYLEEGNYWNDVYWGVCNGEGENHLGKILMKVRDELKNR